MICQNLRGHAPPPAPTALILIFFSSLDTPNRLDNDFATAYSMHESDSENYHHDYIKAAQSINFQSDTKIELKK